MDVDPLDSALTRLVQNYRGGRMSRRDFLSRAAVLGLSLAGAADLLTACENSTSVSPSARTIDRQATVRMAFAEDTWPPQGAGIKSTTYAYPLNMNVYESLILLGSDYSLRPGLAESWELVAPATWRFRLRRGVTFHDGTPMTADDVVWTFAERALDAIKPRTVLDYPPGIGPGSVKKIDDYTVDITPVTPNLRLPEQILHPEESILPRNRNFDSMPSAGTGPFRVIEYVPGQRAVFERFEGYWGAKPNVKRMEVRFLPDSQTRLQALLAGDVDFVFDVAPTSVRTVQGDRRLRAVISKPGRNQLIYINDSGTAPHDLGADASIREAVSLAIDRQAYVAAVFDNNADPGRWMAPQSLLGKYADGVAPVAHDPQKAQRVLDAAGWTPGADGIRAKSGRRLSLDLIGWVEVSGAAYQLLQAQLKGVGIEVNAKPAADTPTYSSYYKNTRFDLDLEVPNQNDGNPAFLPVLRMYSKTKTNFRFVAGPKFDAVAAEALMAQSHDQVQRLAAQMMKMLINEDNIVVPLAGLKRIYGMKSNVDLPDPHPSQTNQRWDALTVYR